MSLRDFRCQVTGVSLMGSEVALIFTQREKISGLMVPATVPLWGRYEGDGNVADIQEGPNADLILSAFRKASDVGSVHVDWKRIGLPQVEVQHIETLASLAICAQLTNPEAFVWDGSPFSLCLLQAHAAAALMEADPKQLSSSTSVEELPWEVVGSAPSAHAIYSTLNRASPRLRCKFGLSFVALQGLKEEVRLRGGLFDPPGQGVAESERQPEQWLAEALISSQGHAGLTYALAEYSSAEED